QQPGAHPVGHVAGQCHDHALQAGVGKIGTIAADGSGNWTSATVTLTEGTYAFTATQDAGNGPSVESTPFLVTIDQTAPALTLYNDATTYSTSPQLWVNSTDRSLPASTTVTIDVDLNNDGDFLDAGESGYATF